MTDMSGRFKPSETLVLVTYLNPRWLRIYQELAVQRIAGAFLDVDKFNFPRKKPVIWHSFKDKYPVTRGFETLDSIATRNPSPISGSFENEIIRDELSSEFFSYFRDPEPNGFLPRWYRSRSSSRLRSFSAQFSSYISQGFKVILVPNGRTGLQRAAARIAREEGLEVYYLETGAANNLLQDRFFLESFAFHDRIKAQDSCLETNLNQEENRELAQQWLGRRVQPNSKFNSFSRGWSEHGTYLPEHGLNLFFNSSSDEYWALGDEWKLDSWRSQYQAFDRVLRKLYEIDPKAANVMRLHPNLKNKALRHVRSELREIKQLIGEHPNLKIVWPHQGVNSYSLVSGAKRLIVSMSTIGLEGNLMGKSVWCVQPNHYDLVADVRRVWSPSELENEDFQPWESDTRGAEQVIACIENRGIPYLFTDRLRQSRTIRFGYLPRQDLIFRVLISSWRFFERRLVSMLITRTASSHASAAYTPSTFSK